MSIVIPPEFDPVAAIVVGSDFPKGNEDELARLGEVWEQTAQEISRLVDEINPATAATFESLEGAPADPDLRKCLWTTPAELGVLPVRT